MINYDSVYDKKIPPGVGANLETILDGVAYSVVRTGQKAAGVTIGKVVCDSRAITDDTLFIALPGTVTDGHRHIPEAVEKGCSAIVVQKGAEWHLPEDTLCTVVEVADSRLAYARAAEKYYGSPAEKLKLIGLTGTNGKTTITYLVEDVLERIGYSVGVIGTVNYRFQTRDGKMILPSPFTTPEAMQLQALLFEMVSFGVEYVIMEVSSHALAQQRIGNLLFDVAAFTNLSQDHLDYHKTMEEYFDAKKLLFSQHLKRSGKAVISKPQQPGEQIDWSGEMAKYCADRDLPISICGSEEGAAVRITDYRSTLQGSSIQLKIEGEDVRLNTPLVGHFNVDNLATALAVVMALGEKPESIVLPLSQSVGAPGRLQRVQIGDSTGQDRPAVFVDYAHTPDALKQVLATLSAIPHRELYCVFGCGGDRDTSKRPLMGYFAGSFSDVAVVTDDNPRSEDPDVIRDQVIPGVVEAGLVQQDVRWLQERAVGESGFTVIGSREKAIAAAIKAAGSDDIVLIAGKGHEKYQLSLHGKRYFDDYLEAQTALLAWNLEAISLATVGKLVMTSKGRPLLGNVSTDSRTIGAGDVFVALQGDRFDGHAFLHSVRDSGAGCLVIDKERADAAPADTPRVEVANTLTALGDLARFRRRLMNTIQDQVVVGLTGSCGKTTVKEMTGAIFRRQWPAGPDYPENAVLQTKGNLNNLIGLPLSLLPITPRHRAAVLEMGMNAPGEIRTMARIAEPDICCITNVHGVHLAGLHDIHGVAAAKGELFAEASEDAVLVVNLDDEHVQGIANNYSQKKVTYSVSVSTHNRPVDVYASDVVAESGGVITFTLHYAGEKEQIHLYTVGVHNVSNALSAAAIAIAAGVKLAEIAAGLADFRPSDRRMVQVETSFGVGVLNDTYNANPASMEAGLKTLVQMGGAKVAALLGDMLELGESAKGAHKDLGRQAASLGVNFLGIVGEFSEEVAQGAVEQGLDPDNVLTFDDKEKAAEWVENLQQTRKLVKGDWLLVKASRGLQMETIVERLTGNT